MQGVRTDRGVNWRTSMKKCDNCKTIIYDERETCPLCHKVLDEMTQQEMDHACETFGTGASYPNVRAREQRIRFVLRLILFIFVTLEIIAIIVNVLTPPTFWWSALSGMGMLYMYIMVYFWVKHDSGIASKIGLMLILTMFLVIGIDYYTGHLGWALEWVVPGLILLGDGLVFFFMMLNRESWISYSLLLMIFMVCSIAIMILYVTHKINGLILPIICIAITGIYLLATIILGGRKFSGEMERRFHV